MTKNWKNAESNLVKAVEIDSEKYLTASEAAAFLYVCYDTLAVWRRTERHRIPYLRMGRRVLYKLSDLIAFRQKHMIAEGGSFLSKGEE